MTTPLDVLRAAKNLSPQERAEIAHELLLTLESEPFDENAEQNWAEVIRQRLTAIREGRVTLLDWDETLSEIRVSLQAERPA